MEAELDGVIGVLEVVFELELIVIANDIVHPFGPFLQILYFLLV